MRRVYDLIVIIIIGVILADFLSGFYAPNGSVAPFGGGSGVILSGLGNLWSTSVGALLGNPIPDQPAGPNPPGSQAKPAPKAAPKPAPKQSTCCCFVFGKCLFHNCTIC